MNQSESEMAASEVMKSDKSLFIQELVIQTLSMDLESFDVSVDGEEVDSLHVSVHGEEVESEARETVDESVTDGTPSTLDSVTSDRVKVMSTLNECRLPSIEDEEIDEIPPLQPLGGMTGDQVTLSDNGNTNPTISTPLLHPGPDENINPLPTTASCNISCNNTTTLPCHPAPLTGAKIRSSHSESGSIGVPSPSVSSTSDPLSLLTTNFFSPPITHPLVSGGAVGGVSSRGTSPSPWTPPTTSAPPPPPSRPSGVRRSNSSSGASSSGPSHPMKRGPPPTIPTVVTPPTASTPASGHRHES